VIDFHFSQTLAVVQKLHATSVIFLPNNLAKEYTNLVYIDSEALA